ncbi:MAG: xanthine dehydrogenase family protein molybdopterin-binding subunit [Anaerolineales bacterium]
MTKYVGTSARRFEDPRFLQGKGRYVANIQLPGMAHAAILRSPHAHAKINGINTGKAAALEGVVAVFTGQDLIDGGVGSLPSGWNVPDIKVPSHYPLTADKVRHVGDAVAVVVAESSYIAADARDLIEVDYEVLPAVVDPRSATEEGAPLVHDDIPDNTSFYWALGDQEASDKAFAAADHVVELELANQRLIATAIEPRAAIAQWNPVTEEMTLWTTSQNPHINKWVLSMITLGIPEHKLRLISPDVGGGFGSKIPHYPEEIIVPWVARAINRPVKWVAARTESATSDVQGRDHRTVCRMALKSDGTVTAIDVKTWANMGAYISLVASLIPTAFYVTVLSGTYKIPAIWGEVWGTFTNTVWVDAYRGAGRPEGAYVVERLMDLASHKLNMDPIQIRRKNFIPADEFPYQTPVAFLYDSGDYPKLVDSLVELADYNKMREDQENARQEGRLVGIGVATCIESSGAAPSAVVGTLGSAVGFWEMASIRVHPSGQVSVMTGAHAQGQGHETTFAQIAADELGLEPSMIDIVHGDTAAVSQGMGTYGSRSTAVGGTAIVKAAEKIRAKAIRLAAHQLEASEEDIVYDQAEGKVYVKGSPDKAMTLAGISFAAYQAHNLPEGMEPGLEETAYFDPANFTFPNAAHIAQVEVDRETGEVAIQRYIAVDDCGIVINPMIVEGQVAGGIAQGVGQALWEKGVYDENGQLLSGTLMDYALPRADRFPAFELGRTETPAPFNPLGVKGVGEMGTIASTPTMVNAVMDALAPLGIKHLDMPLIPEKIWQAIQSSENGG